MNAPGLSRLSFVTQFREFTFDDGFEAESGCRDQVKHSGLFQPLDECVRLGDGFIHVADEGSNVGFKFDNRVTQ